MFETRFVNSDVRAVSLSARRHTITPDPEGSVGQLPAPLWEVVVSIDAGLEGREIRSETVWRL